MSCKHELAQRASNWNYNNASLTNIIQLGARSRIAQFQETSREKLQQY